MNVVFLQTWKTWIIWRNERGMPMRQFTTGDLNKRVGDVTDAAAREPVVLTRHKKPRFVLMSYEHYERMRAGADSRRAYRVSEMPDEHAILFDEAVERLARGEDYDDEP